MINNHRDSLRVCDSVRAAVSCRLFKQPGMLGVQI